jgi:hypothetical protein
MTSRQCLQAGCVANRHDLREIGRILRPSLQPGGSTVDALNAFAARAQKVVAERDRYRRVVAAVVALAANAHEQRCDIEPDQLTQEINRALYWPEMKGAPA